MTRKELKKVASKIASLENKLHNIEDNNERYAIEQEMMRITRTLSFEDMMEVDEFILKEM